MENNQTTDLQVVNDTPLQLSGFVNKESFEHIQRIAKVFSSSELVPKRYQGNIGNCVIALEMSNRMGINPLMVMQNLDIILGRPAWSSKFLIASVNACGKFSPLRYEEDTNNGGRTRAWAYDIKNGNEKIYGPWVSMEMAKAEGWLDKSGSKWKTMPELMRRYRAASFFANQYAPEISMGFPTTEEIFDISHVEVSSVKVDKEQERIHLMLNKCFTVDEVSVLADGLEQADYDKYEHLIIERKKELAK